MKSNTFAIQNLNSLLNLIVFLSPINKYNRYEENNFNVDELEKEYQAFRENKLQILKRLVK